MPTRRAGGGVSLGLDYNLSTALQIQATGSLGRRKPCHPTVPSSARCLGLWEQTGTLETKRGAPKED